MKQKYIAAASSVFLALAVAGPVGAVGSSEGEAGMGGTASFSSLDTNGDGYLTKQEAEARSGLVENWEQADSNGDQQIDTTEFAAFEIEEVSQPTAPAESQPESGGGMNPSRQY
jgi:hypothetical protein